jgi:hypothetical protein
MGTSADEATTSGTAVCNDVLAIAKGIWSELEASSVVEPPLMLKPFYNDVIKKGDKTDYKRPLEMMTAVYLSAAPKLN